MLILKKGCLKKSAQNRRDQIKIATSNQKPQFNLKSIFYAMSAQNNLTLLFL